MNISNKELMDLYVDTLQKAGMDIMSMSDEELEYNLFEEFDVGATSFLHEENLYKLQQANFLTESIVQKSKLLREKYFKLINARLWSADSVRSSKDWLELFRLSDEIKQMIKSI